MKHLPVLCCEERPSGELYPQEDPCMVVVVVILVFLFPPLIS